jgi:flagellar basal-body rod protein FlgB
MSEIFSGISPLSRAMDFHSQRHNVLASNIANANTPGFKPQELLRAEGAETSNTLPLARTEGMHLASVDVEMHGVTLAPDRSHSGGLDENTVSMEREMSKLAANDLRYESSAKMIQHKLGMLKYAANDGTGG